MIRVLLVVNTRLYREGLARLLDMSASVTVVGAESTGRQAVPLLEETAPDVALVDMAAADLDEITAALAQRSLPIPLVAMGISESEADVLACAEMGAAGYVTRESSLAELTNALQSAADGELICSPRAAGILMRRVGELAAASHRNGSMALLTHREREVASLMCEHLSNKDIAIRLGIEVATVKNHVHNVLDKLRVHRRTDAVQLLAHEKVKSAGQS